VKQREWFTEAGVPQPRFATCKTAAEARAAAKELGYPLVVKAPDRQGQRGLSVVANERSLDPAVASALEVSRSGALLVEELAQGREITVNAYSVGGRFHALTITDRHTASAPAFGVALAHSWPCSQPPQQIAQAIDAARRAAAALGIGEGPTYTQVIVSERGAFVGELAARLGGGHDGELCRVALGVDLNDLALDGALGIAVPPHRLAPRARVGGACVRFLVAPEGELREMRGLDEAFALDGVKGIRVYRRPGFVFGPLRRGSDRAGAILAVADSAENALARANEAAQLIRFVTADAGATAVA
jgi:biotin carboxylase